MKINIVNMHIKSLTDSIFTARTGHDLSDSSNKKKTGFTLIELLVTISIFIFMTILVISRYGAFNQGTLMTNLAYDMALSIHTAQTYGISVKTTDTSMTTSESAYNSAYGIHLDLNNSSQYVMFADGSATNPPDGIYNTVNDSPVNTYNITQGASISDVCVGSSESLCTSIKLLSTVPLIPPVDITFKRPDPGAIICYNLNCTAYTFVKITITSGDGSSSRTVSVNQNGEISVGN